MILMYLFAVVSTELLNQKHSVIALPNYIDGLSKRNFKFKQNVGIPKAKNEDLG